MRIEIDGVGVVEVDETFMQMDPAAQEAFVSGIVRSVQAGKLASDDDGVDKRQRTRAAAQGLTFGFADEIEAAVRAPFSSQTYGEIRDDVRGKVEDYREADPLGAIGYEVGGAAVPGLLGLLTGGTGTAATGAATTARLAPTMARAAKIGAMQGAAYGYGSGEGGIVDRTINAGKDAAIGMVAAPIGQAAASAVGSKLARLVDHIKRVKGGKAASSVANEVQRIAQESGLSVDDIAERVARGEIMAEMTPTTMATARAIRSKGGEAAGVIEAPLRQRAQAGREAAMGELQGALTEGVDGNVYAAVKASDDAARLTEKAAYDAAFKGASPVPDEVINALADILERDPKLAERAAKLLKVKTKQAPFFDVEDGQVVFTRPPTLQEAELVRRSVNNATTKAFNKGDGALGEVYGDLEGGLRGSLDQASPALQATRAQASTTRTAREAFKDGQMALSQGPDQVSVRWSELQAIPGEAGEMARKTFRAGIMDALRKRSTTGQGPGMMNNISSVERAEGQVLRQVLTPEQAASIIGDPVGQSVNPVLGSVGRAAQSQTALNRIVGGSQTAETTAGMARLGQGGILSDVVGVARGDVTAAFRMASKLAERAMSRLNDEQRLAVAKMLVETDRKVLLKMLQDTDGEKKVAALVERFADRLMKASRPAAVVGANQQLRDTRKPQ